MKKIIGVVIYILICTVFVLNSAEITNAEWDNKENNLYLSSAEDLLNFSALINEGKDDFKGKTVFLCNDIDLKDMEWTPIGNEENSFLGTFEGNNYTIRNLRMTVDKENVGFFGHIGPCFDKFEFNFTLISNIKNLKISGAKISIDNSSTLLNEGIICGSCLNCSIENCYADGYIICNKEDANIGGIVGNSCSSYLKNCKADVNITAKNSANIGGIIGFSNYSGLSIINSCSSDGQIDIDNIGSYYIGGIIGINGNGIYNSYSNIKVNAEKYIKNDDGFINIGGIIGQSETETEVFNCYFSGQVVTKLTDSVGGIVGNYQPTIKIVNCYFNDINSDNGQGISINEKDMTSKEFVKKLNADNLSEMYYLNTFTEDSVTSYKEIMDNNLFSQQTEKPTNNEQQLQDETISNSSVVDFKIYIIGGLLLVILILLLLILKKKK